MPRSSTSPRRSALMADRERTLKQQQPASPDADASGEAAPEPAEEAVTAAVASGNGDAAEVEGDLDELVKTAAQRD